MFIGLSRTWLERDPPEFSFQLSLLYHLSDNVLMNFGDITATLLWIQTIASFR